jgi:tellurium resistance protein TerD
MDLTRGGNTVIVPAGSQETQTLVVGVSWPDTDLELNVSGFVVGADGRAVSEDHFVFFNNSSSPDRSVWLLEPDRSTVDDRAQIGIVLDALPAEAAKVIVTLAVMTSDTGSLGDVGWITARVVSLQTGHVLASARADRLFTAETLVNLVEVYRYQGGWKARAVLQGYNSGLAGIATDLGIEIA